MSKLFVICGHGAGDSGACGNGYQEQERVRALGKCIKELGGSEVLLGDINRNFYADNGISKLAISKDYQIIELHMDSDDTPNPRGAHVIISGYLDADDYDNKLADYLSGMFPGRAQKLVGRTNLANPDRARLAGYSYRLVEIGFISNVGDVATFNSNIDGIAKGILSCFNIGAQEDVSKPADKPAPTPQPLKWSIGTPVCVSSGYGTPYGVGLINGDYEGTITQIELGAPYPYLIDNRMWVNDALIDADPHVPGSARPASSGEKYSVGDPVCTNTLAESSSGGQVYKGDWKGKITRVVVGAPYPYLLNNGTGWTNDAGIDSDPHDPR